MHCDGGEPDVSDSWHDEARKLREQGLSFLKIARQIGKKEDTIRWAIEQRFREAGRIRKARSRAKEKALDPNPTGWTHILRADPPKQKHAKPRIVPKEEKMAACVEFAKGKIDRAELMRRITP